MAEKVFISVSKNEKFVMLEISDNGKGFDTGKQSNRTAFINIHNRVEAFNGHSTLISSPGMMV